MSTENPVFQLLVPTGNQAILAAGSRPSALAVGQLGFFNYHTGLSIDGTVITDSKDIVIMVGKDSTGGSTLDSVRKSGGDHIQARKAKSLTVKAYLPSLPKIYEITNFYAKCDSDYQLKIEFRSQRSYGLNGFNQFTKTFDYHTACCPTDATCATCPAGDPNDLAAGMMNAINADLDGLALATLFANILNATFATNAGASASVTVTVGAETFTVAITSGDTPTVYVAKIAAAINATTTSAYKASSSAAILSVYPKYSTTANTALINLSNANGTSITAGTYTTGNTTVANDAASIAAFVAAHLGVYLSLRITSVKDADTAFNGNIPIKYYSSRDVDMIISLTQGFFCNGTLTKTQDLQYEDGQGRELAYLEYEAGGWNGRPGPYRTSAVTGLQKGTYSSDITATSNYTQIVINYDNASRGGWQDFNDSIETIIAIPCADSTTLQGFFTISDLIFVQFGPMTNDVASITCNGAGNVRTGLLTPATDGIENYTG